MNDHGVDAAIYGRFSVADRYARDRTAADNDAITEGISAGI